LCTGGRSRRNTPAPGKDQLAGVLEYYAQRIREKCGASVAAAVAFLLSDRAASITGQTLVIDAGMTA